MEREEEKKAHCLILPYSVQGHINPMLQFAKRLLHKRIAITLVVTKHLAKTTLFSSDAGISLQTISDGYDDGLPPDVNIAEYLARVKEVGSTSLREAMQRLADSGRPVDCLVYDSIMPWALPVAEELRVSVAAFFTQSCAVDHIYHHVYSGDLKVPLPAGEEVLIPGLPPLLPEDLPSFVYAYGTYPPIFDMVVNQFAGLDKADWLFFNTFYKLEEEVIDYMAKTTRVKAIGPAIPSMYLDKQLPDDREYGLSIYKPASGACMTWLNDREPASVIYVSFGSLAKLEDKQMEELACGLQLSNKHFLWVVRETEQSKLPKDFAEETSEKGLIVSWCPQMNVLSHHAICCFVTHCGWNSTLEALSLGVPLVAMPQWTDQCTNSKFIMDVWKTGIRAFADENGLVGRETIASCIRDVVEGERGVEIKKNVGQWKELAREAMAQGGNSDLNIQEFVSSLACNSVSNEKA